MWHLRGAFRTSNYIFLNPCKEQLVASNSACLDFEIKLSHLAATKEIICSILELKLHLKGALFLYQMNANSMNYSSLKVCVLTFFSGQIKYHH